MARCLKCGNDFANCGCGIVPVPCPEQVRGETHGDYAQMSLRIQTIKSAMHSGPQWDNMSPGQREALELIATKIGRIVCGDPNFKDHWDDIIGYCNLAKDRIPTSHARTL